MIEYLDALKGLFPERVVKGIIVSGREDRVSSTLLRAVTGYEIEWLTYEVSFKRLASSPATRASTEG